LGPTTPPVHLVRARALIIIIIIIIYY